MRVSAPASEVAEEVADVPCDDEPPPLSTLDDEQQDPLPVTEEPVSASEKRYGLRPVAVRRARAAELRYEAAARRRAGSART